MTRLRTLIWIGAALTPAIAAAQTAPAPPQATSGVASVVNNYVISNYDVDQRTLLFAATSRVQVTPENRAQIRAQVLRTLEDETIELQEAGKRRITASRADVEKAVQNIAGDNRVTAAQLLNTLQQAGVSNQTFLRQVSAQLIWQRLVIARYGTDVLIGDMQVDEAMDRLRQGADKPQFLLSEIFVGVDTPEDETTIRANVEQIAEHIKMGAPFEAIAGQFSQSPSAADGGDIGWVIQGQLAEELDEALLPLHPGQITAPIRAEGGYYILRLRDRREPAGSTANAAPVAAPDPNAPVPLNRLLIPLPENTDQTTKDRAMALAASVQTVVRACADLPGVADRLPGTVFSQLGAMNPQTLQPELRGALLNTGPGEIVPPFFSPAGLELIMRCDARPSTTVFELPTREQLEQQLFMQQMSNYAKTYLRDLRRSAVVYRTGK